MLTKEILESVKDLTPEQITAITTLSQNDEKSVLAVATRDFATNIENDIATASGVQRNPNEKYFDFAKRVIGDLKVAGDTTELTKKITDLEAAKVQLEKAVKDGNGDAALKTRVQELEQSVKDSADKFKQLQETASTEKTELEKKYNAEKLTNATNREDILFSEGLEGLAFKDETLIPKELRTMAINNAKAAIRSQYLIEDIDDGKGGLTTVLRDKETKVILNNKDKGLAPFSLGDKLRADISLSGIVDLGKSQTGAGTNPAGGGGSTSLGLSQAKNQQEAHTAIKTDLLGKGLAAGSSEYQEAYTAAWNESKVADLPQQ